MRQEDSMAELFRETYLARSTGFVERQCRQKLFFRGGELFLDRFHPCAESLSQTLACLADTSDSRPAAHPELSRQTLELARELASTDSVGQLDSGTDGVPEDLVGPLPTVLMVLELAVHGCTARDLLDRLGGDGVRFESSSLTPALQQLPGLDPDMADVFTRLAQPATVEELRSCSGVDLQSVLRGLVKLRAVGLATEVGKRSGNGSRPLAGPEEILSKKAVERFSARIAEDLETDPLDLPVEEHRVLLAGLVGRLGHINHYELFGVDPRAGEGEVLAAYRRLARKVHPVHVRALGLEEQEGVAQLLFERATEAYLTLSEPKRRASYNLVADVSVEMTIDPEQREKEKKELARQNYRLAASYMSATSMEYSGAVELMQEATRLDPQPEYFALLDKTQGKNPHWYPDALKSLRRAVDLRPDDAKTRIALARLLEKTDDPDEARNQYHEALQLMPDHSGAQEALDRLGGVPKARKFLPFRSRGNSRPARAHR